MSFKELNIGNKIYTVKRAVSRMGLIYIMLEGIDDRLMALELHSKSILAEAEDISLEEGEFFVQDLIGCTVMVDGEDYGKILSIDQFGSADVITIQGRFGTWQFPYLEDVVLSVDIENKTMVLDPERFDEVRV